jgi:hypothetical protein
MPDGLTFDETTHTYRLDNERVPHITQVLALAGLDCWEHVPPEVMAAARARGTAVHRLVQFWLEDDLDWDTVDESLVPYLDAYLEFATHSRFEPDMIETPLVHRALRFAGTPDLVGPFGNMRGIVELKSGGITEAAQLQTAGQAILVNEPCRRFGLQLKPNGRPKIVEFTNALDRNVFLSALSIAHFKLRNGGPR